MTTKRAIGIFMILAGAYMSAYFYYTRVYGLRQELSIAAAGDPISYAYYSGQKNVGIILIVIGIVIAIIGLILCITKSSFEMSEKRKKKVSSHNNTENGQNSVKGKLLELESLHNDGILTDEEYEQKRKDVISKL